MGETKRMINLIIAGSRDFDDYERLSRDTFRYIKTLRKDGIAVLSGCAMGADVLGGRFALEHGHELKLFPADWKKYGKGAGFIRNQQMVDAADAAIFFWDGVSRGTSDCISRCKKKGIGFEIQLFGNKHIYAPGKGLLS